MISTGKLCGGNFDDYDSLFIEIPFPIQKAGLHIQPGGTYLRAFYRGDWDKMSLKYEEILDFAQKHRWKLSGYSYEMIINESVIDKAEDSIVQIEIPVIL